ncbi:type III secretion system effector XopF1 [Xanthomonas vasicola]|uniref:type III secretion system effector XopF1 n=1 Tax=Xanthomonas vasicola TaxID=56459 RepID=UPI000B2B02EA|nr:type III secretion system effector XopF1 [Xanthomonas vasicola]
MKTQLQRAQTAPEAALQDNSSPAHPEAQHLSDASPQARQTPPSGPLEGLPKRESISKRLMRMGSSLGASFKGASVDKASIKPQRHPGESSAGAAAREARLQQSLDRNNACVQKLKAEFHAGLKNFPFEDASPEQMALEAEYIRWAEARIQERVDVYGADSAYHIAGDMKALGNDASLPLAYDCLKGLIIGTMRGPFGNMVALPYQNTHLPSAEPVSTAALAGAIGGLGSFTCDTMLLPAMDRRARVANMPVLKKVDPKILIPDPAPVLLQITANGTKRFVTPGDPGVPSKQELTAKVFDKRSELAWRQDALTDASPDTMMLRPAITGLFSGARRSFANHVPYPLPVEVLLSALTGAVSGAFHKGMLHAGKVGPITGQGRVSDLLGGHQRLNLFAMTLPDQTRPPATWSDAVHIPLYILQTSREGIALAKQVFTTGNAFRTALRDLLGRHMAGSLMSNLAALGTTKLIVSPLRHGQDKALPGEPNNSPVSVLQQALQSFFSDVVWNSFKAKVSANTNQSNRLDFQEAIAFHVQDTAILRSLRELRQPVETMIEMLSPLGGEEMRAMEEGEITQVPFGTGARALRKALEQLRDEMRTRSVSIESVQYALEQLATRSRDASEALPDSRLLVALTKQLTDLWQNLVKNEELSEWQEGVI